MTENGAFWHFYTDLITLQSPMPKCLISKEKLKWGILVSVCISMQVAYLCHSNFRSFWQPSCICSIYNFLRGQNCIKMTPTLLQVKLQKLIAIFISVKKECKTLLEYRPWTNSQVHLSKGLLRTNLTGRIWEVVQFYPFF